MHKNRRRIKVHTYEIFKDLAIIVIAAKLLGIFARKINVPQVVGEIIAGLLIGPSVFGWVNQSDFLSQMAEIGVILLMFSAGLGTNLKDLKKTGIMAFVIACVGVLVPLICGTVLYMAFYGFSAIGTPEFFRAVFIGVILTATSVSITVQTLAEMGKLKTKLGTAIVSAAIIDDIIGIVVLAIVIGLGSGTQDTAVSDVIIRTVLFFVAAGMGGFILYKFFKKLDAKYRHTQRIPIFSLALCMALSYIAEKYFGVADITGAFVAGVILCNIRDAEYIERKIVVNSYMLFGPVFFAGIGIRTEIDGISGTIILFSICFIAVALLSKVIGCGLAAKAFKLNWNDSIKVGVGMMTRGEVALIVAQKGLSVGMLEPVFFTPVILLIILSSILTPIFLKILYSRDGAEMESLPENA